MKEKVVKCFSAVGTSGGWKTAQPVSWARSVKQLRLIRLCNESEKPQRMTVGQWLDIWQQDYLGNVKASTAYLYGEQVKLYLKPTIGSVELAALSGRTVQGLYNSLGKNRDEKPGLSPKSIKNVHGILHKSLQQAVALGYIPFNPTDACTLPRIERKEILPLDEPQIAAFLEAIKGHRHELLYKIALFTGMREGELLGLGWDCVDFRREVIIIKRQLRKEQKKGGQYYLASPKNGKTRTIAPAHCVMEFLRLQQMKQAEQRLSAGAQWVDTGMVFTNAFGNYLSYRTVYDCFKRIVKSIGIPSARFHDLRHTFAVMSLSAGDDPKTVQENLGHHSAAFTLDVYGHVTAQMNRASALRMDQYIKSVFSV